MKRFVLFIAAFALITALILEKNFLIKKFNSFYYYSPCDTPIHYKIGATDARFNISENELLAFSNKAAGIWNKAAAKQLFIYDPKGTLLVNFIFDIRQALKTQINTLKDQIQEKQNALNPEIAQYENDVRIFKNNLADLNNQIETWNKKGGAPPDIYNQLIQKQKNLQNEANRLNTEAIRLNQSTNLFNVNVSKLNQTVNAFNEALVGKPEEGLYDSQKNTIDIFFLTDQNEIIHTLAHEMGHALGLNHVADKSAIMYSYTNNFIVPTATDIDELNKVCAEHSLPEIFIAKLNFLLQNLQSKTSQTN